MDLFSQNDFEQLQNSAQKCVKCPQMCTRNKVLSWANGSPDARLMFIAEAPGRLGAELTMVPLHGDKAGDNFERLLQTAGLSRNQAFVTNAVLCNPQSDDGNNRSPSREEIENCAEWLKRQIDLVNPSIVVTLGAKSLAALDFIEQHKLKLSEAVRTRRDWYGRTLIPLYHPGQRAMLHRSLPNQQADYYFVAEELRRLNSGSRRLQSTRHVKDEVGKTAVRALVSEMGNLSLFQLHKFLYLIDYYHFRAFGEKLTGFHYIRQKDGPYCVDIAGHLGKSIEGIEIKKAKGSVRFYAATGSLFESNRAADEIPYVQTIVSKFGSLSHAELKTQVYLTKPMKDVLRKERSGTAMLNAPLLLEPKEHRAA